MLIILIVFFIVISWGIMMIEIGIEENGLITTLILIGISYILYKLDEK